MWPSGLKCSEPPKVSVVQSHFTRNAHAITIRLLEIPHLSSWACLLALCMRIYKLENSTSIEGELKRGKKEQKRDEKE